MSESNSKRKGKKAAKRVVKSTSWNIHHEDFEAIGKIATDFNVSKVKMAGALVRAWNRLAPAEQIKCIVNRP